MSYFTCLFFIRIKSGGTSSFSLLFFFYIHFHSNLKIGPISAAANNFLFNNSSKSYQNNSSVSASPTNISNLNGSVNFSNFEPVS